MAYAAENVQAYHIPAPVAGMNATRSLATMSPVEAVYMFNLLPQDDVVKPRPGYIEWANGWTGDPARTVLPFQGNESGDDKLFVANNEGIWDVTTQGETSPTQVVTFGTQAGDAGICSYVQFTNDGAERYLLVCDQANGYYYWEQSSDTWTKAVEGTGTGEIENVDPADFVYVMAWKQRIWFIERNTGRGWYLPTQAFAGSAASFNFGAQFTSGGFLKAIANWTLDGGAGIDDYLVAVSSSGDVVIYQGTDPANANTFSLVGGWRIGDTPEGHRITKDFGGELYILSIRGLVRASQLLQGNVENPDAYLSSKVAPYLRTPLSEALGDFGWHIHAHPQNARLYVNAPPLTSGQQWGFSYYFGTQAWGIVRAMPKGHTENWRNNVYWTDNAQNKLYLESGTLDAVYLDPETDGAPQPIYCDMLGFYSTLEVPARNKRVQFIRPMFISDVVPSYFVSPRYDYDTSEVSVTPDATADSEAGIWGTGVWGVALWADDASARKALRGGGRGMGTTVAVAMRLTASSNTSLVGYDCIFDIGGYL